MIIYIQPSKSLTHKYCPFLCMNWKISILYVPGMGLQCYNHCIIKISQKWIELQAKMFFHSKINFSSVHIYRKMYTIWTQHRVSIETSHVVFNAKSIAFWFIRKLSRHCDYQNKMHKFFLRLHFVGRKFYCRKGRFGKNWINRRKKKTKERRNRRIRSPKNNIDCFSNWSAYIVDDEVHFLYATYEYRMVRGTTLILERYFCIYLTDLNYLFFVCKENEH